MNRYADTWQDGDVVSMGLGGRIVGNVVVLKRQSDGKPYRKVQLQTGAWQWPDGWVLGAGPHEKTCRDCGQPYRTDDTREIFCPACNRSDYDGADSRRSARVALRGNTTATKTEPVASTAVRSRDDDWSPF